MPVMTMEIIGYHGTSQASKTSILKDGFIPSGSNEWFGAGIYFFETITPLFDGYLEAKQWALCVKKYNNWAVIEAIIRSDNVLDLVKSIPHKQIFDQIRTECLNLHRRSGKPDNEFTELVVFTKLEKMGFDAIRCIVDAMKNEGYYSYVVRRPQVQVCVKNNTCIVQLS